MNVPRRFLIRLTILGGLLAPPCGAQAAVRVTPEGGVPFTLVELVSADGTRWYDAEGWLRHLPGATDWDATVARLTYREGSLQVVLLPGPPYALKGSRPLADAPPTRMVDGRLAVSERFLVERSSDLLGRRVAAEPVHGTGVLRIVLDPAHGGTDRGATAPGAPAERDAVLQLALETASRMRKRGFEVRLTREDGRALSAADRAAAANRLQADLFLSLHASGAARAQARGYEVFLAERARAGHEEPLWSAGQASWSQLSHRWAETVRAEIGRALGSFDRGVREIPSPLLEAVSAPACALEAGNLSWPEDAEVFTGAQQRGALAAALADAAETYFRNTP